MASCRSTEYIPVMLWSWAGVAAVLAIMSTTTPITSQGSAFFIGGTSSQRVGAWSAGQAGLGGPAGVGTYSPVNGAGGPVGVLAAWWVPTKAQTSGAIPAAMASASSTRRAWTPMR